MRSPELQSCTRALRWSIIALLTRIGAGPNEVVDQTTRRIEFLKSKLEELAMRKQRLTTIISSESLSNEARSLWAKRLDWVIKDIRKHTAALAKLETE